MNILAFDLATKTGWAVNNGDQVWSGVEEFALARGESPGMRFLRFRAFAAEIYRLVPEISVLAFEQAHHRGGAATAVALGLQAEALAFAAEHKIETMPIHSATLKKWATGKGNAGKPEMITAARKLCGGDIIDDNHADALLLRLCASTKLECENMTRRFTP